MKLEREAFTLAVSATAQEQAADWLLDGSERRRQRPKAKQKRRVNYSDKKKAHTDKNLLSDLIIEVACGLYNLQMACRHPLPSLNLIDLYT